jgi:Domain of unknown function (DUF4293)
MIQRQQTLWLIVATICAFLTFEFPFFTGNKIENPAEKAILDGASNLFLILFTGASLVLSFVTIFLFKDRKLQGRLCLIGIALSFLLLFFYYLEIKKLTGTLSLSSMLVFAIPIGFFMAYRGIRADQKLVKSLDKLR